MKSTHPLLNLKSYSSHFQKDWDPMKRLNQSEVTFRKWRISSLFLFVLIFLFGSNLPVFSQEADPVQEENISVSFECSYPVHVQKFAPKSEDLLSELSQKTERNVDVVKSITITDSSGEETLTVWNYQLVNVNIVWDASDITDLHEGDYFEVQLPPELRFPEDDEHADFDIFDTTGENQKPAGHVVVTNGTGSTPGKVRLTFSDYVEDKQNIQGTLTLGAQVYVSEGGQGNIINTEIKTNTGEVYSFNINVEPVDYTNETIIKWLYQIDDGQIVKWRTRINLSKKALDNVEIIDYLSDESAKYVQDSFWLTRVDFDEYGNIANEYEKIRLTGENGLTFNAENNSFTLELGTLDQNSYLLEYETTLPNNIINNKITLNAVDIQRVQLRNQSQYVDSSNLLGNIRGNSPEAGTPPENQPEEEVGKIKIIKVEQGKPDIKIAGAVFRITKSDDPSMEPIELTTGLNGEAISPDLVPGDYQIKEIHVPAGYLLNSQTITVTVTAGNTYECTISDRKVPPIPSTGLSGDAKSMTSDSGIPEEYTDTEMELEIPMLDITIPIVKVPLK